MTRVLFLIPPVRECSVHCTALNVQRVLKLSDEFEVVPMITDSFGEVFKTLIVGGFSILLVEHNPVTLPWLTPLCVEYIKQVGIKTVAIVHHGAYPNFDAYIVPENDPDYPTFPSNWFPMARPLPKPYIGERPIHPVWWIGTMGFCAPHKGFVLMVSEILNQFDSAHIRICAPQAPYGINTPGYATAEMELCERMVRSSGKHGITIETTTEFIPVDDAVDWLAQNDLNCYLYRIGSGIGRATSLDTALAAKRPIAVSKSPMLHILHGLTPSVCYEDTPLLQIISNGIAPLQPVYDRCSDDRILEDIHKALRFVLA